MDLGMKVSRYYWDKFEIVERYEIARLRKLVELVAPFRVAAVAFMFTFATLIATHSIFEKSYNTPISKTLIVIVILLGIHLLYLKGEISLTKIIHEPKVRNAVPLFDELDRLRVRGALTGDEETDALTKDFSIKNPLVVMLATLDQKTGTPHTPEAQQAFFFLLEFAPDYVIDGCVEEPEDDEGNKQPKQYISGNVLIHTLLVDFDILQELM